MSKIKRYDLVTVGSDYYNRDEMRQDPDGEWVRWEDVKDLIAIADDVLDMFKEHCENMKHPELFAFLRRGKTK
jgi:hypothetical protein